MKLEIINTGFNTGEFNMNYDIELAGKINYDQVIFRLYRWKPYCISLGANQDFNSINIIKTSNNNIDIVKRPTGGRAILHSEELTYSVILPIISNISAKNVYHHINLALFDGLKQYNSKLSAVELESKQVHFPEFYKEEKSAICFAISAKNELKFNGKKLVGSAQRKLGKSILQHGSVLCGPYHLKIIDYLNFANGQLEIIKSEIENTTTDLQSILKEEINYKRLEESMIEGFSSYFESEFRKIFIPENETILP